MSETQNAEVIEISLEQTIETKLVQANVTQQVLAALKEKYGSMKLKAIDDKESYLELKEAAKECSKLRNIAVKICKAGREEAVAVQKKWVAKEKEVVGEILSVEDKLDAEIAIYDAEVERKANEEKKRQEEAYINRQATLTKMGAKYEGGSFVLGEVSFEAELVKGASQEVWEDAMLPSFVEQFEIIEAMRIELEKEKQRVADELKRQQEELLRQQAELKAQQEEMQRKQAEAERLEKERIAKEQKAIQEQNDKVFTERLSALKGWSFNGVTVSNHGNVFGSKADLYSLPSDEFNKLVEENVLFIQELAKKQEAKRLADIEAAKQEAIKKEQERLAEEQRLAAIAKQQEEEKKKAELDAANDRTKWENFINSITKVETFEMRSSQYRKKMQIAKEKLAEILSL